MARKNDETALAVVWTDRALADLEAIGDVIARDNTQAAEDWVFRLIALAEGAGQMPLAGRRVPEMGREDVRERLLRKYRIVYRVWHDRIEILTIFEGHRLFPEDAI